MTFIYPNDLLKVKYKTILERLKLQYNDQNYDNRN